MHERQRSWLELGETADRGCRRCGERGGAEHGLGVEGGLDEVGVVDDRRTVPDLGEQVAAEQGACRLVEQHLRFPAVWNVGCRNRAHRVAAESGAAWSAAAGTGGRSHKSLSDTMQPRPLNVTSLCGATSSHWFIAPLSSDSTWPKLIQRSRSTSISFATASDTSGKELAGTGVEQQRFVVDDEVLVEGEPAGGGLGDERRQAVDTFGDFMDVRLHAANRASIGSSPDIGVATPN